MSKQVLECCCYTVLGDANLIYITYNTILEMRKFQNLVEQFRVGVLRDLSQFLDLSTSIE